MDSQKRSINDCYRRDYPDNCGGGARGPDGVQFCHGKDINPEEIFNVFSGVGMPMRGGGGHGFQYDNKEEMIIIEIERQYDSTACILGRNNNECSILVGEEIWTSDGNLHNACNESSIFKYSSPLRRK